MYAELYGLFLPSRFSRYVHNTAIQMAADTGIVGGLPFALFLLYAAGVACWRILRSSDLLIKALGIGILIFIFWNMFDFEWYLPAIAAWFMVAVAFVEADISVADAVLAEEEG
jgi:O-antigen ligase